MKKEIYNNYTYYKEFKIIIYTLILLFFNNELNAQVLWFGDPNLSVNDNFRRLDPDGNSNPTGNRCVDDPNNRPFVLTPTDPEFGKFWRVTKPISRKRAELARTTGDKNNFVPENGGTYYYGWRWRVSATPNINSGIAVFQWKTDQGGDINSNKQNYPFNLEYDGTNLSLHAFGPAEPNWNRPGSITQRRTTLWERAISEDQWLSFVIKVKVDNTYDNANNRYNGYVEFWFNGEQQTLSNTGFNEYKVVLTNSNTRAYHRTNDGIEVYPKWGAYNENACDKAVVTDFDEMRVTTTLETALPSNYNENPDPDGLEGLYRVKNKLTGNYMTYNPIAGNIVSGVETNDNTQLFRLVKNGNEAEGKSLFNIDSEVANIGVLRAEGVNVFSTSTIAPSTSNPNSFKVINLGEGIYNFMANTTQSRFIAEDLDGGNINYTSSAVARSQWFLERIIIIESNNFTIETIGETCIGKENGIISIKAKLDRDYTVTLNGNATNFTSTTTLENLSPGTYDFCITILGDSFKQCYQAIIEGGTSLTGKINIEKQKAVISIEDGTAPYTVLRNGQTVLETYQSNFSVDVTHDDDIQIKTKSSCQGKLVKRINLLENIKAYPNPSNGLFDIFIPSDLESIHLEVYNIQSQIISSKVYPVHSGVISLNISENPNGIYFVKVNLEQPVFVKLIKK